METKIITISSQDLHSYFKTLSNNCKIRVARSSIYKAMPKDLKVEFKNKYNDLLKIGSDTYKIFAFRSSDNLQAYLNQFVFKIAE